MKIPLKPPLSFAAARLTDGSAQPASPVAVRSLPLLPRSCKLCPWLQLLATCPPRGRLEAIEKSVSPAPHCVGRLKTRPPRTSGYGQVTLTLASLRARQGSLLEHKALKLCFGRNARASCLKGRRTPPQGVLKRHPRMALEKKKWLPKTRFSSPLLCTAPPQWRGGKQFFPGPAPYLLALKTLATMNAQGRAHRLPIGDRIPSST